MESPLPRAAATRALPDGRGKPPWRFWAAGYTYLMLLAGTNLATPLYRDYERAFGFSPLTVTLVFAAYVAALVPSLLIAGPLSDAVGRRQVLLPAVALAIAGSAVFAAAAGTAWLYAGRIIQGVAVGAASGPLTAVLAETEPHGRPRRAALVATAASVGGLGLGPLLGGALAQYAPAPRVLPFAVEIAVLIPAAAAMAVLPAAAARSGWRPRRPWVPAAGRGTFWRSGIASFAAFAVIGLFLALIPAYVAELSGSGNLLLGGGAVALLIAASLAAQLAAYAKPPRPVQAGGLFVLAAGLILLAVAGVISSLPLVLTATVVAGAGQGLVFLGGLTEVSALAPPAQRAGVLSAFYVIIYLGVGLPVIGVGFAAAASGLLRAVQYFAVAVAAGCLAAGTALTRRRRSQDRETPWT